MGFLSRVVISEYFLFFKKMIRYIDSPMSIHNERAADLRKSDYYHNKKRRRTSTNNRNLENEANKKCFRTPSSSPNYERDEPSSRKNGSAIVSIRPETDVVICRNATGDTPLAELHKTVATVCNNRRRDVRVTRHNSKVYVDGLGCWVYGRSRFDNAVLAAAHRRNVATKMMLSSDNIVLKIKNINFKDARSRILSGMGLSEMDYRRCCNAFNEAMQLYDSIIDGEHRANAVKNTIRGDDVESDMCDNISNKEEDKNHFTLKLFEQNVDSAVSSLLLRYISSDSSGRQRKKQCRVSNKQYSDASSAWVDDRAHYYNFVESALKLPLALQTPKHGATNDNDVDDSDFNDVVMSCFYSVLDNTPEDVAENKKTSLYLFLKQVASEAHAKNVSTSSVKTRILDYVLKENHIFTNETMSRKTLMGEILKTRYNRGSYRTIVSSVDDRSSGIGVLDDHLDTTCTYCEFYNVFT